MDLQALYQKTALIKQSLLSLEDELINRFGNLTTGEGNTANPRELYAAFKTTGLIAEDAENMMKLMAVVEEIQQTLSNNATGTKGQLLGKILDFIRFLSSFEEHKLDEVMSAYSLFIQPEKKPKTGIFGKGPEDQPIGTKPMEINLWCFDSSKAVRSVIQDGARNIIFTSGTLSPLDQYISNVGLNMYTKEWLKLYFRHL